MMNIIIFKYYKYNTVLSDSRFSFDIAFKRLNGVLKTARQVLTKGKILIVVPADELSEAKKNLELNSNECLKTFEDMDAENDIFDDTSQVLVFDEQGFYASPELVHNVIRESHGQPCTWDDPERLIWSFNFHDSCRFFVAPSPLIKKHIKETTDFPGLQSLVFGENTGKGTRYTIKPEDIPPIYKRAVQFNPYPYHYYIEPTSRCNSRCIMCPFHSTDPKIAKGRLWLGDGGDDMPLDVFKRLVDEIASIGWNYLPHYRFPQVTAQLRGEPTLAPNCKEMFAYVKEKGLRLSFTTNGSYLHCDGLAEFLIDIGIDEIIVSIDGDEDEYSKIRPALDYKQVVRNLKLLRRLRDQKGTQTPVLYTKRVHLRNSSDEADRKYLDNFSPIADWAGIGYENYDDFNVAGKAFTDYFFEVDDHKRLPCIWATDVSVIKANGKVDMCFGAAEHHIGDVYEKPLLDILRDSELRGKILDNHSVNIFDDPGFCRACTSWKHNYHIFYEDDTYSVKKNPILAYWKRKNNSDDQHKKTTKKNTLFGKLLTRIIHKFYHRGHRDHGEKP